MYILKCIVWKYSLEILLITQGNVGKLLIVISHIEQARVWQSQPLYFPKRISTPQMRHDNHQHTCLFFLLGHENLEIRNK